MGWAILDQRPIYKGRVLKARILAEGSHIEEIVATLGALGWRIR